MNVFHNNQTVIDQKPERDDYGSDRDLLNVDANVGHQDQCKHHREGHDAGDDHRRSKAQKDHHYGEDNEEGLANVRKSVIHRNSDIGLLKRRDIEADANGLLVFKLNDPLFQFSTQLLDVTITGHFNTDHQRGLSIEIDGLVRRVDVSAPD